MWMPLKSRKMRSAYYDERNNRLTIKFYRDGNVHHDQIPPHIYQNLIETKDPDFYYRYYIEPARVGPGSRETKRKWMSIGFALVIFTAILFIPNVLSF